MGWSEKNIALLKKYGKQHTVSKLSEITGKSTGAIYSYAQRHNISLSKTVQNSEFECLSRHRLTLPVEKCTGISMPYGIYIVQSRGHAYALRIEVPMKVGPIYKEIFNFTRHRSLQSCLDAAKKRQNELGQNEWGSAVWYHIKNSSLIRKMPKDSDIRLVVTKRDRARSSIGFIATTNIYPDGLGGKKKRLAKSFCIFKHGYSNAYLLAKKEQELQRKNWFEKCLIHNE